MPYVTNGYIFTIAPSRVPFFVRPIANMIFSTLNNLLVKPNLLAIVEYVSTLDPPLDVVETQIFIFFTDRQCPREVSLAVVRWGIKSYLGRLYDALPNGGTCFASLVKRSQRAGQNYELGGKRSLAASV